MINKEPVYIQINKAIRQLILSENYSIGDKFLTERTVCERFDVSRSTANKSLSSLVSENILEFKKGIGTFIKSIPDTEKVLSLFRDPLELLKHKETSYTVELINRDSTFLKKFSENGKSPVLMRRIKDSQSILAIELIFLLPGIKDYLFDLEGNLPVSEIIQKIPFSKITDRVDRLSSFISTRNEMIWFATDNETALLKIETEYFNAHKEIILKTETIYNGERAALNFKSQNNKVEISLL